MQVLIVASNCQDNSSAPLSKESLILGTAHNEYAFINEPKKKRMALIKWRTGQESWHIGFNHPPIDMKILGDFAATAFMDSGDSVSAHFYALKTGKEVKLYSNSGYRYSDVRLVDTSRALFFGKKKMALVNLSGFNTEFEFASAESVLPFSNAEEFEGNIRVILYLRKYGLRLAVISNLGQKPSLEIFPPLENKATLIDGYAFGDGLLLYQDRIIWLSNTVQWVLRAGRLMDRHYSFTEVGRTTTNCQLFGQAEGNPILLSDSNKKLFFLNSAEK
jgi:hypothetical protein